GRRLDAESLAAPGRARKRRIRPRARFRRHPSRLHHARLRRDPADGPGARRSRRTRRSVVTAAVAGYETIARVGMAAPGAFHAAGWHATAVCGTFAATLAAGRLEG